MPRPRVAVVIPTLDEEAAIGGVLAAIPHDVVGEIIVADGGSGDRTVERARAAGARIVRTGRGYGHACLAGAKAAEGCDILVFLDGDGSDRPELIPVLVAPILDGSCDFAIGSRTRGRRERGSMSATQLVAGHAIGLVLRLLYGVRYTDMCPFRAIRRGVLLGLGMREMTFGWNLEMQMRAARAGLRIREIAVDHRRRAGGVSKVSGSLSGTLKAGLRIGTTLTRIACEGRSR